MAWRHLAWQSARNNAAAGNGIAKAKRQHEAAKAAKRGIGEGVS